ncbi:hypothetical protein [Microvirga alba]|uniref:Uncharacterized protein n=1 Tax=Microvirga alba TaxID=2791025 RepID=A0A931FLH0_9HYPH|nr:hypothetical protein [Microvirga alba]MBF9232114.1 hypothetical protein [Microvirga alba]
MRLVGPAAALSLALALGGLAVPAVAATYDFVPAPQTDLNRIYRIDRITGEVSSCQYGLQEGTIGVTLCFSSGEGAGPQAPGEFGLVASRHEREGGVFRVNYRTGDMSICYVFDEKVVCTPQTSPSPAVTTAAPSPAATPSVRPGTGASPQRP